jgi:hypothetical protein
MCRIHLGLRLANRRGLLLDPSPAQAFGACRKYSEAGIRGCNDRFSGKKSPHNPVVSSALFRLWNAIHQVFVTVHYHGRLMERADGYGDGDVLLRARHPGTFLAQHDNLELREAVSLAQRLVQENIIEFCVCWDSGPGEGSSYQTYNLPPQDELDYGVIDCLVIGFPYIRSRFAKSGLPADSADIDKLGFGIAMSSEEIRRFLAETDSASDEVKDLRSPLTPWN